MARHRAPKNTDDLPAQWANLERDERDRMAAEALWLYMEKLARKPHHLTSDEDIASRLEALWGVPVNGTSVRNIVGGAWKQGLCHCVAETASGVQAELEEKSPSLLGKKVLTKESLRVIHVRSADADPLAMTGMAAARWLLEMLEELKKTKKDKPIGVGFSSGRTARLVCKSLSELLRFRSDVNIRLHALNSGWDAEQSNNAPVAFFSYFEDTPSIGLFSPPLVKAADHTATGLLGLTGIKEAFAAKREIDIVVSSLGVAQAGHNHRLDALEKMKVPDPFAGLPEEQKPVGDIGFRAYSKVGPLTETGDQFRAVSVFELSEIVSRIQLGTLKCLLVIAPDKECPKGLAAVPLIQEPSLRVFTQLLIGIEDAQAIAAEFTSKTPTAKDQTPRPSNLNT